MKKDKLTKLEEALGKDVIEELTALSSEALKARCTNAHKAIKEARDELDASPEYQEAKENVKAIGAAFRDLKSFQTKLSDYCIHLLQARGE